MWFGPRPDSALLSSHSFFRHQVSNMGLQYTQPVLNLGLLHLAFHLECSDLNIVGSFSIFSLWSAVSFLRAFSWPFLNCTQHTPKKPPDTFYFLLAMCHYVTSICLYLSSIYPSIYHPSNYLSLNVKYPNLNLNPMKARKFSSQFLSILSM